MEEFRQKIKKSIKIYKAVIIGAILLWIVLLIVTKLNGITRATDFGDGFCVSVIIIMAINISQYSSALKSDEKLKKLYISETDERTRLIQERSYAVALSTTFCILGLSAMVTSFFYKPAFYTLVAVIIVIAAVQGGFQFYFSRKY